MRYMHLLLLFSKRIFVESYARQNEQMNRQRLAFRLDTPLYELTADEKLHVYEPAEDTFLLLDALEADFERIKKSDPLVCVEIGCGSGVVSAFLAKHLKSNVAFFATDVNPLALNATNRNVALNDNAEALCVLTNLLVALQPRLNGVVDLLAFNPPYVPTEYIKDDFLSLACDGGLDGTAILMKLLPDIYSLLSSTGSFYVVALAANRIEDLLNFDNRLTGEIILQRKCGIERLYVLKFVKNQK